MTQLPKWAEIARKAWSHRGDARPPFADAPEPGQESVWDYPRPPALVADPREVVVRSGEFVIARTSASLRLLETSHPPTFYIPRGACDTNMLRAAGEGSRCEWKGVATYFDVVTAERTFPRVAWSYESPFGDYRSLAGHLAFYAHDLDCVVAGERARPQPGGFYGGWITSDLSGPFKGDPGSSGW